MQAFCTIITSSHIPFANVLFDSLKLSNQDTSFYLLVTDEKEIAVFEINPEIKICSITTLLHSPTAKNIYEKYAATNPDHLRWTLKPVFITYLLENGFDKVIFCDPDIFFAGSYDFLFKQLDSASVLLTPHWNNINVFEFEEGLFSIMRNGLFNAGFVAASKKGLPAMRWWAGVCHYKMDRQVESGVYDDQKYLDILPVEFPGTEIVQHRGCNIACWNMDTNKRTLVNGKLLINGTYEVIFIHFTHDTIRHIINGNDYLLRPYLDQYESVFQKLGYDLQNHIPSVNFDEKFTFSKQIKRRLLLKTRFKRWLLKLSQRI